MSESRAAEDYKAFESLRNRFKDESGSSSSPSRPEPRKSGKRRFDPRANAPPLVPLIEEGDILQEVKSPNSASSPIKGRWKHSNHVKSNHLNGPDFDALETSSTASLSSAFSEPGNFSPVLGSSLSELSDAGSCETFSEYDIKRPKSRITSLKAPFEHSPSRDGSPSQVPSNKTRTAPLDVDVSENFVSNNKRAWDKVIGEWKFNGIPHAPLLSSKPKMRRPSSEVRVPTPLSTPLGSMDNLLTDSESRSSILSDDYTNFDRRLPPGRLLNKPRSRPSSASCVLTGTKRNTLTMAIIDDRSSSDTSLAMQKSERDEEYKVERNTSEKAQHSSTLGSDEANLNGDEEREDDVLQLPNQYKLGKFISISDTMLPTEERTHEYISEGSTPPKSTDPKDLNEQDDLKPVQPEEPVTLPASNDNSEVEENPGEDEAPILYQPGKFVSQTTSVSTPDLEEKTREDMKVEKTAPPTPTCTVLNPVREHILEEEEEEADKPTSILIERASTPPANRWFNAYLKCKAQQAHQKKKQNSIAADKLPANQPPPVEKPQIESSPVKDIEAATAPQAVTVETDNFERVQKITLSKSHKWLEAMRKYKALKSDMEQNTLRPTTNIQEGDEPTEGSVTTPTKSAKEPTLTTLAQRAQIFGGMRKKPPLRRTKSFQVGSDNASSPLAVGISRPTRVLKKQMTASFN